VIRVLVVDDSAFMRKALSRLLGDDPEIRVVGSARDGYEALEKVQELDPDLVTLDVEMPRMDGLETLARIMESSPRPVIMVSSLTEEGAEVTLRALDMGAVDYVPKSIGSNPLEVVKIRKTLCEKVKAVARRRTAPRPAFAPGSPRPTRLGPARLVAIGASTGGPPALQKVFSGLTEGFRAPVVVVQHMPRAFTKAFAKRLDAMGPLAVKEAETGDRLEAGQAFVAPGGRHVVVHRDGRGLVLQVTERPTDTLHRPSVDVTFGSVAEVPVPDALAVVLTGMGSDGAQGAAAIKARGGTVVAQSPETCVVYGMPRAVVEAGVADAVLPIDRIAPAIQEAAS